MKKNYSKIVVLINITLWIIFYFVIVEFLGLNNPRNSNAFIKAGMITAFFSFITYFNTQVLIPKFFQKNKYFIHVLLILTIVFISPYLFSELMDLVQNIFGYENEFIIYERLVKRIRFRRVMFTSFIFIFVSTSIKLTILFSKKEKEKLSAENEKLVAEIKFLKSQISPHFLLNALNNLHAIIRLTPTKSSDYIGTLANMLRYVTYECQAKFVTIKQEIEYIKNYIYFHEINDDRYEVQFMINVEDFAFKIEPLIFIVFVENAFKHGGHLDKDKNSIQIGLTQKNNSLTFTCNNSVDAKQQDNDKNTSGLGLRNIQKRLNVSYPNRHEIEIESTSEEFNLTLKILN